MSWRKWVASFPERLRERAISIAVKCAPKSYRDELDRRISSDAERLNAKTLDAQGFVRCHVCPERFGGGMRAHILAGRKVYLCGKHYREMREGRLVLG